jgi:hypothetical protein
MTIRLNGSTSGYVEIDAPAVAGAGVLTLPTGTGTLLRAEGGKVLQVVEGVFDSNTSLTTTTSTDIGLSASITPSLATSKVLVVAHLSGVARIGTLTPANTQLEIKVLRGATTIYTSALLMEMLPSSGGGAGYVSVPGPTIVQLDSPSTTSSTTYKLQARNAASATDGLRILFPMRIYLIEVSA